MKPEMDRPVSRTKLKESERLSLISLSYSSYYEAHTAEWTLVVDWLRADARA